MPQPYKTKQEFLEDLEGIVKLYKSPAPSSAGASYGNEESKTVSPKTLKELERAERELGKYEKQGAGKKEDPKLKKRSGLKRFLIASGAIAAIGGIGTPMYMDYQRRQSSTEENNSYSSNQTPPENTPEIKQPVISKEEQDRAEGERIRGEVEGYISDSRLDDANSTLGRLKALNTSLGYSDLESKIISKNNSSDSSEKKGDNAFSRGEYDAALQNYDSALSFNKDNSDIREKIKRIEEIRGFYDGGIANLKEKRYDLAIDNFKKGLGINSGDPNLISSLRRAEGELNLYNRIKSQVSNLNVVDFSGGVTIVSGGNADAAITQMNVIKGYNSSGISSIANADLKEAEMHFRRGIGKGGGWMFYNNLGIVYAIEGKYDSALRNFRTSINMKKGESGGGVVDDGGGSGSGESYGLSHYNLAIALNKKGSRSEAARIYQKVLNDANPSLPELNKSAYLLAREK